jgi:replicative DNA helicase
LNPIQLEDKILCTLISYPERLTEVEDILRPQCFTEIRKNIYEAMISLNELESPIDALTIFEELKRNEVQVQPIVLANYQAQTPALDNLDVHVKLLYEKWLHKELDKLSKEIVSDIKKNTDPFEIISKISDNINLLEHNIESKETRMIDDLPEMLNHIEKRMQGSEQAGLMSDTFPSLNKATGGIMPTDYVVVYGDYKMGKTTLAEQLFLDIALNYKSVGIFNLEMTKETLYQKALSMRTGIDYLKLRNPRGHNLTADEFNYMKRKAYEIFDGTKIYVEDRIFDIDKILAKMKVWKKKYKIDLFVLDYLGLLEGNKRFTARHLEIANYSRRLKNVAKQIETPLIVLSQANGDNKTAESKNPARDADFVISVCKPLEAGINSIKDRNGQTFNFAQDHFLVTMENSRHGKNKQNFVCQFQNNNFVEITLEYF